MWGRERVWGLVVETRFADQALFQLGPKGRISVAVTGIGEAISNIRKWMLAKSRVAGMLDTEM